MELGGARAERQTGVLSLRVTSDLLTPCLLSCSLSGCPRAKKSGVKILHSKEDKDEQEPIR